MNLQQRLFDEFGRLDLATTSPMLTAPLPTDQIWRAIYDAIEYWQNKVFLNSQAYSQFASTITSFLDPINGWQGNLYALPSDFEIDTQLLINISGQNTPMNKVSEIEMNNYDIQGPPTQSPIIGPPAYYTIYQNAFRLFPWPDQPYKMTAVYTSIIGVPVNLGQTSFWTVEAEAMIRHYAKGIIKRSYTREDGWQTDFAASITEFNKLQGRVRQVSGVGRARAVYL